MTKLTLTIGLPSSGKSTWAREQQALNPKTIVVERDQVRERLFGSRKNFDHEKEVTQEANREAAYALAAGYDVIVADTNLATKYHKQWRNLATAHGATFETRSFTDVSVDECVRRDALRPPDEAVGEKVIRDFAQRYNLVPAVTEFAQVVFDTTLPRAVICDLDGTAALMGPRSPYEHGKYHLDIPSEAVHAVVWGLLDSYEDDDERRVRVVYCSGRKETARAATLYWLAKHGFPVGELFMRADDDNRKDDIVKYEILRDVIAKRYYPTLVLDDRNQVVKMWRSQGLPTFQVAEGDF